MTPWCCLGDAILSQMAKAPAGTVNKTRVTVATGEEVRSDGVGMDGGN